MSDTIVVDGLVVGPCMVRDWRERLAAAERERDEARAEAERARAEATADRNTIADSRDASRAEAERLESEMFQARDIAAEHVAAENKERRRAEEAEAEAERLRGALREIAAMECVYGDGCGNTGFFGHSPEPMCAVCRARAALGKEGAR